MLHDSCMHDKPQLSHVVGLPCGVEAWLQPGDPAAIQTSASHNPRRLVTQSHPVPMTLRTHTFLEPLHKRWDTTPPSAQEHPAPNK